MEIWFTAMKLMMQITASIEAYWSKFVVLAYMKGRIITTATRSR